MCDLRAPFGSLPSKEINGARRGRYFELAAAPSLWPLPGNLSIHAIPGSHRAVLYTCKRTPHTPPLPAYFGQFSTTTPPGILVVSRAWGPQESAQAAATTRPELSPRESGSRSTSEKVNNLDRWRPVPSKTNYPGPDSRRSGLVGPTTSDSQLQVYDIYIIRRVLLAATLGRTS